MKDTYEREGAARWWLGHTHETRSGATMKLVFSEEKIVEIYGGAISFFLSSAFEPEETGDERRAVDIFLASAVELLTEAEGQDERVP